jgi:TolA-binding protein
MKKLSLRTLCMLAAMIGIAGGSVLALRNGTASTVVQDPGSLDRRLTTLETRLFSIESNVRQLEQQMSIGMRTQPMNRAPDQQVQALQSQVQTLQLEIDQLRCGLLKLDERTRPSAGRASNSGERGQVDPCRSNPDAPLLLSPPRLR